MKYSPVCLFVYLLSYRIMEKLIYTTTIQHRKIYGTGINRKVCDISLTVAFATKLHVTKMIVK